MPTLRRLHRYAGVFAALFVLWLAGSGLLLQHAPDLGLQNRFVTNAWLLSFYDVHAPAEVAAFYAGTVPVTHIDQRLFLGHKRVLSEASALRGALPVDDGSTVIALADMLLRVNAEGEVLDRIGELDGVAIPILQLGQGDAGAMITRSTRAVQQISTDFLHINAYAGRAARYSVAKPLQPLAQDLQVAYLDGIISVERLLADMHSGRLPGGPATALIDVAAVALILLALSGIYMFARPR